jgi:CBS domain-containing protein
MFGGVAEMRGEPPSPKAELLIALAGPLMSVALGLLFALTVPVARTLGGPVPAVVCGYLAWGNLVLALFNMIPAFPLDGGRVLRAALWAYRRDLLWGTRVSARIGEGFGYLLVALGILAAFSGSLVTAVWFVLLGFLLRGAARRSYQEVVTQRVLEDVRVGRFMTTDVVTVPSEMPLERFVDEVVYRHHHRVYPVVDQGNLVGSMRTRDLARLGRAEWAGKRVLDVMVPINDETSIDIGADALTALQRMRGSAHSRLLVVDGKRLAGVLSLKDLLDHLALRTELELGEEGRPGRPIPHAA